jgi:hypothetical protein
LNPFEKIAAKALNDTFLKLRDEKKFYPAKLTVIDLCERFQDKDGNFIEQFQTNGFDQRLLELLLFAIFESEGFILKQDHSTPDFELNKDEKTVFVEATTSNMTVVDKTSKELINVIKHNPSETEQLIAFNKLKDLYIEKVGSALFSKVSKKYQELKWVKGNPLLLAISPIHDEFARQNSDYLLITYLYGYEFSSVEDNLGNLLKVDYIEKKLFEKRNKTKINPFFNIDDSKYISGVLFFNDLTIDKFNRMGFINGLTEKMIIFRSCDIFNPNSSIPEEIFYFLNSDVYKEDWKQGVSIFHNPNALFPLNKKLFDGFRQIWIHNGKLDGFVPEFFPYNSVTISDALF